VFVDPTSAYQQPARVDPAGSWTCVGCGNVNWPMRSRCNRKQCGLLRDSKAQTLHAPHAPAPLDFHAMVRGLRRSLRLDIDNMMVARSQLHVKP